jgi:hemerythrin
MSNSSRLEVVYKDLEAEHRRLLKLIDRLRDHRTMEGLLPLLDELRTLLIVHFAREQLPDGFYDALGERADHLREEIQVLVSDHGAILSTLNALLSDAKTPDPEVEEDVLNRVTKLIERLQDHERREHRFATEALAEPRDPDD